MVALFNWDSLGLKPSNHGWLSEDPSLLNHLVLKGSLGSGSLAFWLRRDARSPKMWGLWGLCFLCFFLAVLWRDLAPLVVGWLLAFMLLRNLYSMVSMWGTGKLRSGIVHAVEPHPLAGHVIALLEGQSTRVAMKKVSADAALAHLGRFEVLYFEETNPKALALELGFRRLQVSEEPRDGLRS